MSTAHSGFRTARVAACLLLAAIALDLAADTRCDAAPPLGTAPAAPVVRADDLGQPPGGEPCAPVCVPDCFCCSRSLAAGPVIEPPAPARLSTVELPAKERSVEGFRPDVDHPPLLLA